jgi:hypothetical protein
MGRHDDDRGPQQRARTFTRFRLASIPFGPDDFHAAQLLGSGRGRIRELRGRSRLEDRSIRLPGNAKARHAASDQHEAQDRSTHVVTAFLVPLYRNRDPNTAKKNLEA